MKITQCDRILRHLRDYGSISHLEAYSEYGIQRLAARVKDLKRRGHNIVSETVRGVNRYGEPIRYSLYRLIEEKE
ncbi:MAG: helix-turn-helix domain-containing protein [Eubacteriales bacterium]